MSEFEQSLEQDDELLPPSRSQVKREAEALQELGRKITELRADQQAQVPMGERLAEAVAEMRKITANGAKRRQLQYIGRLMRNEDGDAIEKAIARFDSSSAEHNQRFHALESWRERLISEGNDALMQFIDAYPSADIQHLRQLVRNAAKEREQNKAPANARKLFKYLRELDEQA